ncbi:MAG: TolC family protein [Elusimicrobiota bacterium]
MRKFIILLIFLNFFSPLRGEEIKLLDILMEQKNQLTFVFPESFNWEKLEYNCFEIKDPPRLIIYFPKNRIYSGKKEYEFNRGVVKKIRSEYQDGTEKRLDYLVIELNASSFYRIRQEKNLLFIIFESVFRGTANKQSKENGEEEFSVYPASVPVNVDWCIKTAIENSQTLSIAEEEIRLAKIRILESGRNLYPSLAARYEYTHGEAVKDLGVPTFKNELYGLELAQPLYQGGGLYSSWRQAKLNLDVASQNYEKAKQELIYEVKKNYYNFVKFQRNLQEQQLLKVKADNFLALSKRQLELGLITRLDHLNVETQAQGVEYQILSTQKDLSLAAINLNQTLEISYNIPLTINAELIFKEIDAGWEECKQLAQDNRPDLRVSYLNLQVSEYARKISRGLIKPRIDLTGFYGRSGGAYKNENFKMGEDWNVGLKLTKIFGGGNTLSTSGFKEKTSPKLGQTSRTASATGMARLALFDNIRSYSDLEETTINYFKAENEYKELNRAVLTELREAFYNYEKSIFQIQSTKKEIELAKEEIKITEAKFKLSNAQVSDILSASNKLTNANNSYTEAIVYYYISIASLNKGVGITDKWKIK